MFDKLIPWKRHDPVDGGISVRQGDDPFTALRRDFDNLLSRFWEESALSGRGPLSSSVDFDENDKEYLMTAELPGFDPQDIDVKVSGNVLTVKAEHKEDSEQNGGRMQRYGSFYESFTLPTGVRETEIVANYRNGVLEVHVPKDESTPSRRIEVKAA